MGNSFVIVFILSWLRRFLIFYNGSNGILFKDNRLSLILHSFLRSLYFLCLATYLSWFFSYLFLHVVATFKTSEDSFKKMYTPFRSDGYGIDYSWNSCLAILLRIFIIFCAIMDPMVLYLKMISFSLYFIVFLEASPIYALPHISHGYPCIYFRLPFLPSKPQIPVSQIVMIFSEVVNMAQTIPETVAFLF